MEIFDYYIITDQLKIISRIFIFIFFRAFDNNGDGYISKAEIKDAILRFGQTFSAEEADEMFKVFNFSLKNFFEKK